jgi:hypothetical protein
MTDRPKFDPTKPVEFVEGDGKVWPIRILATDRTGSDFPIIGLSNHGTHETLHEFTADGTARAWTGEHGAHLRNRMVRREGWVRMYRFGGFGRTVYRSEEEARSDSEYSPHFQCVARIEWDEPADA